MEEKKKRGRPKGSGEGFEIPVTTKLHPDLVAALDEEGTKVGKERSTLVRDILTAWAGRRAARKAKQ